MEEFHQLHYFKKSQNGICADDFTNKEQLDTINLMFILSLSDLLNFDLPLSGKHVGQYALVTMSNNDKYYIWRNSFMYLKNVLTSKPSQFRT